MTKTEAKIESINFEQTGIPALISCNDLVFQFRTFDTAEIICNPRYGDEVASKRAEKACEKLYLQEVKKYLNVD